VREACRRSFERWLSLLEARLERAGWRRREARGEAILTLAAVEGALTLARSSRDPEPLRTVAQRLRRELSGAP
jgi:Transcriptional regulator LmrA/YxaF-like, C-terminal domain